MTVVRIAGIAVLVGLAGIAAFAYAAFGAFLPWRETAEAGKLAGLAGLGEGAAVADIGAGGGRFTELIARRVGPTGRVYATEIDAPVRDALRAHVEESGLEQVTVIEAGRDSTNLPDGCCDLVLLRAVYHHIGEPDAFARSLRRAVRPGGRLAIVDFEPGALWFHGGRPDEASGRRPGHGVSRAHVQAELESAGFRLEREIPHWNGPLWLMLFTTAGARPILSSNSPGSGVDRLSLLQARRTRAWAARARARGQVLNAQKTHDLASGS
jgi:SAM-dependent methyltransferase